jgi:ABC-2 type transport system permease protein
MIWAVFKAMALTFLRDHGALALAFLLPPVVYVLFAAIFSGTAGDDLRLRLAIFDTVGSETSRRLVVALRADDAFREAARAAVSADDLSEMVRRDEADVGLLIRAEPGRVEKGAEPPLLVLGDAAKAVAGPLALGQIERIIGARLPDIAYARVFGEIEQSFVALAPEQKSRVEAILSAMREEALAGKAGAADDKGTPAIERRDLSLRSGLKPAVVYYAGAVAMMFLLFAATQGAMQLIDERQSGVLDRVLLGTWSRIVIVFGKFLFLMLQGLVQVGLIFAAAALIYGVAAWNDWQAWGLVTLAGAALASGFGLALAAASRTRQQAQALSTFLILVLSAIGGSMVPRFLMPAWLQDAGWAVPNSWVIEAYHGLLWRDAAMRETALLVAPTLAVALVCLVSATLLMRIDPTR